jgi:hypothetical protein
MKENRAIFRGINMVDKLKKENKVDVFLDSGAFSSYSLGVSINLQDYINYIHAHINDVTVYAVLDDIRDPRKTWENQAEMERQGLHPLPVYHTGEPREFLYRAMKYEYFGFGGIALAITKLRLQVCDELFKILCPESNGYRPMNKVHAFGCTHIYLLTRYPWYSADSTSWVLSSRFGSIMIPRKENGKYRYDSQFLKVIASTRQFSAGRNNIHIRNYSPTELRIVREYLDSINIPIGKSVYKNIPFTSEPPDNERIITNNDEAIFLVKSGAIDRPPKKGELMVEEIVEPGVINNFLYRDQTNARFFVGLQEQQPPWPYPWHPTERRTFGLMSGVK